MKEKFMNKKFMNEKFMNKKFTNEKFMNEKFMNENFFLLPWAAHMAQNQKYCHKLKVSKFRKQILKFRIFPKNEQNTLRISFVFGRIKDIIIGFRYFDL